MQTGKIHIGTSGWHYHHWKGTFYPAEIKDSDQFALYAKTFNTVEINNSFYRLPLLKTFSEWRDAAPAGFIFAVKASRFFTHAKKLIPDKAGLQKFFNRVERLHEKLGPVLFQLPPQWKINVERLRLFLSELPNGHRYTFEFRNATWYHDDVYRVLHDYNSAFCIYELGGHSSPLEVTADFVYMRLHGPGDKYQGSYSNNDLNAWKKRCIYWQNEGKDVYIYFDNDQQGYAAFNAKTLLKMLR